MNGRFVLKPADAKLMGVCSGFAARRGASRPLRRGRCPEADMPCSPHTI
jgi:hypothetical protein